MTPKVEHHWSVTRAVHWYVISLSGLFLVTPLFAWIYVPLANVRNWQYFVSLPLFWAIYWAWQQQQVIAATRFPRNLLWLLAGTSFVSFNVCALAHYCAFNTNGIDFSIFDWMLVNTTRGNFMYSPIYARHHFGTHTSWILLPFVPLHGLFQSPLLLVFTNAIVLWSAVIPLWFISRHYLKNDTLCVLAIIAYLTNARVGSILNHDFHFEVFFLPTGLLFLLGWLRRQPSLWGTALVFFLATKEDASFYMLAFALGALVFQKERQRAVLWVSVVSAVVLLVNLRWVQPYFLAQDHITVPEYLAYWSKYGKSLYDIIKTMILYPYVPLVDLLSSHWYALFVPFLFLPLLSRAGVVAMFPGLFILGTSSTEGMRGFGMYYPSCLLPFLFWAFFDGWSWLCQRLLPHRLIWGQMILLAVLSLSPLVDNGYMRFPRPNLRALVELSEVHSRLRGYHGPVCAQTALFPHLSYTLDLRPLSEECLNTHGAVGVLHLHMNTYPYSNEVFHQMLDLRKARLHWQSQDGFVLLAPAP